MDNLEAETIQTAVFTNGLNFKLSGPAIVWLSENGLDSGQTAGTRSAKKRRPRDADNGR